MPVLAYAGREPRLAAGVWIAPSAFVIGDVELGEETSIWFGSVVRGDTGRILLGSGVNVQDNCTLHADPDLPLVLGDDVTLAHGAIVHAARIEPQVLIGIGAVVLSGASIGRGSVIAARTLVPEGAVVPPRSLVLGTPGRVVREVSGAEYERLIVRTTKEYRTLARAYRAAGV